MKRTCGSALEVPDVPDSVSPVGDATDAADDEDDDESLSGSDSDADVECSTEGSGTCTHELALVDAQALWRAGPAAVDAFVRSHFCTQAPRPHQQRAVTRLVSDVLARAARSAPRRNYLVQHAPGSGKSLTLSCLACVLARLAWPTPVSTSANTTPDGRDGDHDADCHPSSSSTTSTTTELVPLYSRVVVVNDRRHLDSQLRRTLAALLAANGCGACGVVARAARLADVFAAHRIVVTTLQKFGARLQRGAAPPPPLVGAAPVALVTDEAHRSYGAAHTRSLHEVLTGHTAQPATVSYFAFTATPSVRAMTMFASPEEEEEVDSGDGGGEGTGCKRRRYIEPFDTYTFDDAIADGFILDFTQNYASLPVTEILKQQQQGDEKQLGNGNSNNDGNSNGNDDNNNESNQGNSESNNESNGAKTTIPAITAVTKAVTKATTKTNTEGTTTATPSTTTPSTTTETESVFLDGKRVAQRLARAATLHEPLLAAKAAFVVDHLRAAIAALDDTSVTPAFRVCAMLAVPTRRHVVWYAAHLRRLVAALPPRERFGVVAAFAPFALGGARLCEASAAVNGAHARLCTPQDGIVAALRAPRSDVRLLVVADKLQTGFDEPRLAGLYVDKPLAGAAVVQTLGRLARAAPGKRAVYVVDFVNRRDAVARAVAQYWAPVRMRRPPSLSHREAQLQRVAALLSDLVPVLRGGSEGSVADASTSSATEAKVSTAETIQEVAERIVAAIFEHSHGKTEEPKQEEEKQQEKSQEEQQQQSQEKQQQQQPQRMNKEQATCVCKCVRAFVKLCNALQTTACDGVALADVVALAGAVAGARRRWCARDIAALGAVAGDLAVLVEVGELERAAALARGPARPLSPARMRAPAAPGTVTSTTSSIIGSSGGDTLAMTASEVVDLANDIICPRGPSSTSTGNTSNSSEQKEVGTYTADELDFARGLWQWTRGEQQAAVQSARRESASKLAVRALLDTAERMLRPGAETEAAHAPLSTAAALVRLVRSGECAAPLFVQTVLSLVEPESAIAPADPSSSSSTTEEADSALAAHTLRELVCAGGAPVVAEILQGAAAPASAASAPTQLCAAVRLWTRVWPCVRTTPDSCTDDVAVATIRAVLGVLAPPPPSESSAPDVAPAEWAAVQCAALRCAAAMLRPPRRDALAWAQAPLIDGALAALAWAARTPGAEACVACAVPQLAERRAALAAPPARAAGAIAALAAALDAAPDEPAAHGALALLLAVLEALDRRARAPLRVQLQALRTALPALRTRHAAHPRVLALLRTLAAALADTDAPAPRFRPVFPPPKRKRAPEQAREQPESV